MLHTSPTKLQFLYFGAESDLFWCQVDLTEPLESWAAINIHMINDKLLKVKPVWRDASFTLKYHSDALFDFPHWFGFSKRKFNVSISFLWWLQCKHFPYLSTCCTSLTCLPCPYLIPLQLRLKWASSGRRARQNWIHLSFGVESVSSSSRNPLDQQTDCL